MLQAMPKTARNGGESILQASDIDLTGQVAFVTGGGGGIGRATALCMADMGADVAIIEAIPERCDQVKEMVEARGRKALCIPGNVMDVEALQNAVAAAADTFGRLDILVNNAAGNFPAPMAGISYNGFKSVVDIDLLGTYNVSKAAFEAWLKDHGGNVVNITAPFQHVGPTLQAHVAAAKSGVDSLTRSCASEWGPHGIRVNAVAPGAISDTEGLARFDSVSSGKGNASCPLRRVGSKQDIANTVLFLASEAASYVTGQVICVDGGSSVDSMKIALDA